MVKPLETVVSITEETIVDLCENGSEAAIHYSIEVFLRNKHKAIKTIADSLNLCAFKLRDTSYVKALVLNRRDKA